MNWQKIWEIVGIPIVTGFVVAFLAALLPPAPIFKSLPVGPTFWQAILGGLIGVVLGYVLIRRCGPLAPRSVTITFPASGSSVPQWVTIQGAACHIPQKKELWLLVVAVDIKGYYPQTGGPIRVARDGTWSAGARIGSDDPKDSGKEHVVHTGLADPDGRAAIDAYFRRGKRNKWEPLDPLPRGIQLMSQVRVVRT